MVASKESEMGAANSNVEPIRSARRQRRRDERYRQIREAALRILSTDGVDALTIQRLADELDLAPASLYRYYKCKDAIVVDLETDIVADIGQYIEGARESFDAFAPAVNDPIVGLARILALVEAYTHYADTRVAYFTVISRAVAEPVAYLPDAEAAKTFGPIMQVLSSLGRTLERARAVGAIEPGDPTRTPIFLWCSVHNCVTVRRVGRSAPSLIQPRALPLDMAVVVLRGFGADATAVERSRELVAGWTPPE